ncbi:MAG: PA14 domain-containing protein [Anaerolineae bacterium]|nr:PA14 domain-containing protein [Thermoflexales bacterium]MDW8407535.1 PA14 domain-containing protein [Anaerolineae bacterium]
MRGASLLIRIGLSVMAVLAFTMAQPIVHAARPGPQSRPHLLKFPFKKPRQIQNARVVLTDMPNSIIPGYSNSWACPCDTDGCWPGCFTVASASVLQYWAQKGYPDLWNGDENGMLQRLRDYFPAPLCMSNGNDNGKPGDTGYDAWDVAVGLRRFTADRNYLFTITPIAEPSFEQIVEEIDAGRPLIAAFTESPWGSHAGTIIGYDTTAGRQIIIVRPHLWQKADTEFEWGVGYRGFSLISVVPGGQVSSANESALAPQITFQVVINDGDPRFTTEGAWQERPDIGHGGQVRTTLTTDPTNLGPQDDTAWARWNPDLPFDGMWEVMAWMPPASQDETESAYVATYRIVHAEGMNLVRRSQKNAIEGWMPLGTFPFKRGVGGSVYLGNLTGDDRPRLLWADAVRFVWRAPIIVRAEEEDAPLFLVQDGQRRRIPDADTFTALRLSRSHIRKLPELPLSQYPEGEPLPSIFGNWVGQYFNNAALAPPVSMLRLDPSINFRWNGAAPAANMSALGFSARWTRVIALSEGVYPFIIDAIGGVRLWVNGRLEIDAWDSPNILVRHQRELAMPTGLHRIEIEYVNREGWARITLGNLPPNVPIVDDTPEVEWTSALTATLRWRDGGDADSSGKPRRFFASIWREDPQGRVEWNVSSGWISATEWIPHLPGDGRYLWRVSASDGTATSDWSPARTIFVDATPPWAQMMSAERRADVQTTTPAQIDVDSTAITTTDEVTAPVDSSATPPSTPPADVSTADTFDQSDAAQPPLTGALAGLRLTWWATDTFSGIAYFDVQARELIRASTIYSEVVSHREVTRIGYELIVSGSVEITQPIVITDLIPYTLTVPIAVYTPLTQSQWVTIATGIVNTETIFLGTPGSTYEFRVRAVDRMGNVQAWRDGYSVQGQIDPRAPLFTAYIPILTREGNP